MKDVMLESVIKLNNLFPQIDTENHMKTKTLEETGTKRSQPMCDVTNKKLKNDTT